MLDATLPLLLPALNRVLDTQPALVARLAAQAGKTAEVIMPPLRLRLAIGAEGRLAAPPADTPGSVTITLDAGIPPRLLLGDKAALRTARVEGDGGLASDLTALLEEFDWALALRPLVGDIAAARAAQAFAGFDRWRGQARQALDRNLGGWLGQESGLLVDRLSLDRFVAQADELRDACDRLAARLALLEARARQNQS